MKNAIGDVKGRKTSPNTIARLEIVETYSRALWSLGWPRSSQMLEFRMLNPSTNPIEANVAVEGPAELWPLANEKTFETIEMTISIGP